MFLATVMCIPTDARSQGGILGAVTGPAREPLAGVMVSASSTALIEHRRTTVTDTAGRYRLQDLPPGSYEVTFLFPGLAPQSKNQVEIRGTFTAIVDMRMAAASLEDTIVVFSDIPIVDVHTAKQDTTLKGDVIRALPTVGVYNALIPLVPGVMTNTNDTVMVTATTQFPVYGGRANEGRLMVDGLTLGSPPSANSPTTYVVDTGSALEVSVTKSGALGEMETGGMAINIVPNAGGNVFRGRGSLSGTGERFVWNAPGTGPATTPAPVLARAHDVWGHVGGPIARHRMWFFGSAHRGALVSESRDVYYNVNAGSPAAWLYSPDFSRAAYSDRIFENGNGRLTWQISARNKVSTFLDGQALCRACTGATAGLAEPPRISPEAVGVLGRGLLASQVAWSSPVTNRILVKAGFGSLSFGVGNFERTPNPTRALIRVVEQCMSGCAANGNIPGLVYRSQDFSVARTASYIWNASVSHVTATREIKAGYQQSLMTDDRTWFTNDHHLTYRLDDGVPNQLTQSISPWVNDARAAWHAAFVQGRVTRDRVSLEAALRFDRSRSWFPPQSEGPSRFLPVRIDIPATTGVDSYRDLTPRLGMAYDVRGNGRTAIKTSFGRYLEGAGVSGHYANTNPTLRMPRTTPTFGTPGVTRSWTDANRNLRPDCDLSNVRAQDLTGSGGDTCGAVSNAAFGSTALTNTFDRELLDGWGVRPSDWTLTVSLQQQLGSKSSLDVTFIRRSYNGFSVVDNLAVEPGDFTPFTIVAPEDPRLPGGGGYPVTDLYDVVPEKFGAINNLVADSRRYGGWSQHFDGVVVSLDAKAGRVTLAGGIATGQTVADNCDVRRRIPELSTAVTGTSVFGAGLAASAVSPLQPYCRVASGYQTQARGFATYDIARAGLQLSATWQSKPGAMLTADYIMPRALAESFLGRRVSGTASSATINLVRPGTMYGDRINHLDVRIAKAFALERTRLRLLVDVYNVLNSRAALTYSPTYLPSRQWPEPLTTLTARFVRVGADIDF